jgi:hypothetical protein
VLAPTIRIIGQHQRSPNPMEEHKMVQHKLKLNDKAIQKLQDDANRAVQKVLDEVTSEMAGMPAGDILPELVRRVRAARFQPNEANLREIAQEISEGSRSPGA